MMKLSARQGKIDLKLLEQQVFKKAQLLAPSAQQAEMAKVAIPKYELDEFVIFVRLNESLPKEF